MDGVSIYKYINVLSGHLSGYKLSQKTFGAMVLRFADKDAQISFDNFISCAIKLKHMFRKLFCLFLFCFVFSTTFNMYC